MLKLLENKGVLITRPYPQGEPLAKKISALGGLPYVLPAIEILPPEHPEPLRQRLKKEEYDLYLFISTNAVHFGLPLLPDQCLPKNKKTGAIGNATNQALQEKGIQVDFGSSPPFDSEAFLAQASLQQMNGQKVLIFRGNGGREKIAQTLTARGAMVRYAEVYRRVIPAQLSEQQLPWSKIQFVIATSGEIIENLMTMPADQTERMLVRVMIVVSQRTAKLAAKLGFKKILIAEGADDDSLIRKLSAFHEHVSWSAR